MERDVRLASPHPTHARLPTPHHPTPARPDPSRPYQHRLSPPRVTTLRPQPPTLLTLVDPDKLAQAMKSTPETKRRRSATCRGACRHHTRLSLPLPHAGRPATPSPPVRAPALFLRETRTSLAAVGPRGVVVVTAEVVVVVAPVDVIADVTTVTPATVPALEVGTNAAAPIEAGLRGREWGGEGLGTGSVWRRNWKSCVSSGAPPRYARWRCSRAAGRQGSVKGIASPPGSRGSGGGPHMALLHRHGDTRGWPSACNMVRIEASVAGHW
ncbi:hypothetical protein E2C01_051463 [Portunus trituberculatus]|uniref:Uncharacterized protein n=1 Tax=Portunus trituberculatus TaxID=210409 RepID=A0A5B7GJ77_PORTR|nr:hypothetical protein [Portunus trituberculatus]